MSEPKKNKALSVNHPLIKITAQHLEIQTQGHIERQSIVAGNLLIANDHVFTDALSAFARYVDQTNDKASSPGGMKTQINKRIKAGYGKPRSDMTGLMRQHCALCYAVMAEVMLHGMESQLMRTKIKKQIWSVIDMFAAQWDAIYREFGYSE